MADYKSIKTVLPRGVAIWPSLNTADTKWKAEGTYSTRIAFDADEPALVKLRADVATLIEDHIEATIEAAKAKGVTALTQEAYDAECNRLTAAGKKGLINKLVLITSVEPFKVELDDETGDETGRIIINAKMTASGISKKTGKPWARKPAIFNAAGSPLKNPPMIGSGSVLKASVDLRPYYVPKDSEVGVSFALEAVQIITLVQFGARDASAFGFGAEDGGDDIADQTSDFADERGSASGADDEDL